MSNTDWPVIHQTYLGLDPAEHSLTRSRVVLLPVPYDATTSYRSGSRDGPDAILKASRDMEEYDPELDRETRSVGIYTAPGLEPHAEGPTQMVQRVHDAVSWYMDAGKLVGMLGGEHSVTAGAVAAVREHYPDLSVLVLDAHADLREVYQEAEFSHANASRRMLDHAPITQVGIRSMTADEARLVRERDIPFFPRNADPITDVDAILARLTDHVYVSVDLDCFDPTFMAAVGTPEPGGMGWWEALKILRAVGERKHIVAFDVMELSPKEGPETSAYTAAKLVYKLIGYATGDAR